ncbi:MAG: hypothetical protein Q9220_007675, partial [cf. Caloplaca sp. 1 TL-2023]
PAEPPPGIRKRCAAAVFNYFFLTEETPISRWTKPNCTQTALVYFKITLRCIVYCHSISWFILFLLFLVVVQGCTSSCTRGWLPEKVCVAPWRAVHPDPAWHRDLWQRETFLNYGDARMPPHVHALLTGGQEMQFWHQTVGANTADAIAYEWGTMELYHQCDILSDALDLLMNDTWRLAASFSAEKDSIKAAMRDFANVLAIIVSRPAYINCTPPSLLLAPWWHVFRSANHFLLIGWLPKPGLYATQAQAELAYQTETLRSKLRKSCSKIDTDFSRFWRTYDRTSVEQVLQKAITMIPNLKKSFWGLPRAQYLAAQEMRKQFKAIRHRLLEWRVSLDRIRFENADLQLIVEDSALFESYPGGDIVVPPSWREDFHPIPSSSIKTEHCVSTENLTCSADFNSYLNPVNPANIPILTSALARSCESTDNRDIHSGVLNMVCGLYNILGMFSQLDRHLLDDTQLSWVQRMYAASRHHKENAGIPEGRETRKLVKVQEEIDDEKEAERIQDEEDRAVAWADSIT